MSRISYLNGKFLNHDQCFVHIEDRAFQFGDGVYEVILFENNKLIDFVGHFNRLIRSLTELNINFAITQDQLENIILELFAKNNLSQGSTYIQLSRGTNKRIQSYPQNIEPTFNITVSPPKEFSAKSYEEGISVMTHQDIRWQRCDIKSLNLLAPSMLNQKAKDQNFDDVIMVRDNFITEGSFANVFIVNCQDQLITPPADNFILCGITRNRVIKLAQEIGIIIKEEKFNETNLLSAKEVFLTSSTLKIRPVSKINNQVISKGCGAITSKMLKAYLDFIKK